MEIWKNLVFLSLLVMSLQLKTYTYFNYGGCNSYNKNVTGIATANKCTKCDTNYSLLCAACDSVSTFTTPTCTFTATGL